MIEEDMVILMADDDEEDCMLARDALQRSHLVTPLEVVHDGEELLEYLDKNVKNTETGKVARPCLILLDLNMPRMDGREALEAIKADDALRRIPVVILTTSEADEDIISSYDMGVNSYVTKPVTFQKLVDVMNSLNEYWFKIVKLPPA